MALADILAAITQQADQRIAEARTAHQKQLTQYREQSEREIATKKQEIAAQKEQRKVQLKAKAENHAAMLKRNAQLKKKQELLDRTYQKVVKELSALPDDKIEPLLRQCIKSIKSEGTIHPSEKHENLVQKLADSGKFKIGSSIKAKGGFLFVSETREQDYTFEHLVQETLRPKTELEISQLLFA